MLCSREFDETKQEGAKPLIPTPTINSLKPYSLAKNPVGLFSPNAKKNPAQAWEIALANQYNLRDSLALSSVCRNFNCLFQPVLLAAKVYYAASLSEIEKDLRKAFKKNPRILSKTFDLGVVRGTLAQLALIGLDRTLRNDQGRIVDEGMAERIFKLHHELAPDTFENALKEAAPVAKLEDTTTKNARKSANLEAIQKVFEAITKNDAHTAGAVAGFKDWLKNQKPRVMTDHSYHFNLIHLLYCAFDTLTRKGLSLSGGWDGDVAAQFCFEIIGGTIEVELPPRIQQILRSGLSFLLHSNQPAPRTLDLCSILFNSSQPSWSSTPLRLGVNAYYGSMLTKQSGTILTARACFQNLLQQLYQPFLLTGHRGQEPCFRLLSA